MGWYGCCNKNKNVYYKYFPMGQNDNNFPLQELIETGVVGNGLDLNDYNYHFIGMWKNTYYQFWLVMSNNPIFGNVITGNKVEFGLYQNVGNWVCYEIQVGLDFSWTNCYQRDYLPTILPSSKYDITHSYSSNFQLWSGQYNNNTLILDYNTN